MATVVEAPVNELVSRTSATFSKIPRRHRGGRRRAFRRRELGPQSTLMRVRISAGTHPVDSTLVGELNRRRMAQDEGSVRPGRLVGRASATAKECFTVERPVTVVEVSVVVVAWHSAVRCRLACLEDRESRRCRSARDRPTGARNNYALRITGCIRVWIVLHGGGLV